MLRIIHAADLHLDSPFASLPPEEAVQRRKQQRRVLEEITRLCVGVDLVLLAGDVFDDRQVRPETVEQLQKAFAAWKVPVFIAPGNHDPYTDTSVWANTLWPDNVHIFTGQLEAVSLPSLRCRVWGAAFRDREASDLLRGIPKNNDGWLEIGVLHGDPLNDGPYNPIKRNQISFSGLDYLALGHIHQCRMPKPMGGTWCGWPGAVMGRGFDETGEKGVFLTALDRGICETKFCCLSQPRYEIWQTDPAHLEVPAEYVQSICRLVLTGESEPLDLQQLHEQLSPSFRHLEIRDETLLPLRLWESCGEPTLRGLTVSSLKARYDAAETPEQQHLYALAARFALSALEGREMP